MNKIIFAASILISVSAHAKIGDFPAKKFKGVSYSSHSNEITATKGGKTLWVTTLPFSEKPADYKKDLEHDVQWCIAKVDSVNAKEVHASDCKNHPYVLNRKTGKLIQ